MNKLDADAIPCPSIEVCTGHVAVGLFFSGYFGFPLSVSFHKCSTLPCQYHSTNASLSPVSTITPMLHSPCQNHSTNAPLSPVSIIPRKLHSPLSVSFQLCSTLPCQYHSTNAPLSPVSTIPPMLHTPLHLQVVFTKRTNSRSLGALKKPNVHSETG
jgi:hypothetical protein